MGEKAYKYDPLELARTIGEPVDPRRPFPTIVEACAEIETASPDEHVYYFDVLQNTEKVLVITASGAIVQELASSDTPVLMSFIDLATPEFYIKITDLAGAKEKVIARKVKTINRALNSYEEYKIVTLLDAATTSTGNQNTLTSGQTKFRFDNLITLLDDVQDYGDNFVLIEGTTIARDRRLWDFDDNKFHSPAEAMRELGVSTVRMPTTMNFQYSTGGSAGDLTGTDVLGSTLAYLVAKDTENGKPLLWVRKQLDAMETLGGAVNAVDGERPQRLVFVSPNPITVTGTSRFLAVGVTGYENIAAAVTNEKAISEFTRS